MVIGPVRHKGVQVPNALGWMEQVEDVKLSCES